MEKISLEFFKMGLDLVLEIFCDLGIDIIFGYFGGVVLFLYDVIYNFKGICYILGCYE